jgi:hypothetical protein
MQAKSAYFLIVAAACMIALGTGDDFYLSHFQERDIARAEGFLKGQIDPYGPETNFGPRLPGSFYAALISLPLLLTGSWESVAAFLSLLFSLSVAAAATYVRSKSGLFTSLLFASGLTLSPIILPELLLNWNPSFGIALAILVNLAGAFALGQPESRVRWALLGALISLGLQVHGTFLAFYPAALWCLAARPGSRQKWQAPVALAFLAGAILPFLPLVLTTAAISPGALPSAPIAEALNYLGSFFTKKDDLSWRLAVTLAPPLLPLLVFCTATSPASQPARPVRIAAGRMALCQLPAAGSYLWSGYGERYALCFVVSLAFWAALSTRPITRRDAPLAAIGLAAALVFLLRFQPVFSPFRTDLHAFWLLGLSIALAIGGLLLAFPRRLTIALFAATALPFTGELKDFRGRMLTIAELKAVSAEAVRITGWSYEEFRWKTIALGLHKHVGFELAYRQALARKPKNAQVTRLPSGLFLLTRSHSTEERLNKPNNFPLGRIRGSIEAAALGDFFKDIEIAENSATCISGSTICLVPYYARQPDFPELVHNLGTTMLREKVPFADELQRVPHSRSALLPLSGTAAIFAWSSCDQKVPDCRAGIAVEARREGGMIYLRTTIVGESLSLTSFLLSPKWTETWHEPFVGLVCGKEETRKKLLSVIGNTSAKTRQIMAPFRRTLAFRCPEGRAASIIAGRGESSIHSGRKFHSADRLPGDVQYWRLPSPL